MVFKILDLTSSVSLFTKVVADKNGNAYQSAFLPDLKNVHMHPKTKHRIIVSANSK